MVDCGSGQVQGWRNHRRSDALRPDCANVRIAGLGARCYFWRILFAGDPGILIQYRLGVRPGFFSPLAAQLVADGVHLLAKGLADR
jgi:hypothetical protein